VANRSSHSTRCRGTIGLRDFRSIATLHRTPNQLRIRFQPQLYCSNKQLQLVTITYLQPNTAKRLLGSLTSIKTYFLAIKLSSTDYL
jgi:hypothetical protein